MIKTLIKYINEDALNSFFQIKSRAFWFWYIVSYIITICFGCLYFKWYSLDGVVPLKLFPFLFARTAGKWMSKKANNEICLSKDVERDFRRMFLTVAVIAMVSVVVYKFTGVNLIWLIM
ncbi:hypothetical protein [Selenomonas ruminantium]|uniref:hypothetical protein n=1 Tax=Selenomonas ruminantium TaxID=971 RepID=UPI0009423189|nr:hypothetical protein [Selenomonas ruminantium]